MAFEKFTLKGKSFRPKISLRKNGHIGFNQAAIEKFSMTRYDYAVLFYDRENKKIGIKLTNDAEEGACKLKVKETNAYVAAKAFLDYYGIDYSKRQTQRSDVALDEELQMLVASIE